MAELILKEVFYRYPGTKTDVLKGVDAVFPEGTVTAVMGRSGAGKSTMLYLLAGLDVPTGGSILYNGRELKRSMLDGYRRTEVATIAQNYLLFPTRTALENVLYPLELAKVEITAATEEAKRHLESVGIPEELHHRLPSKLSGGEQQRVAIARAIAHRPRVIFADEPTAELDTNTGLQVVKIFRELTQTEGVTFVMTTHDTGLMDLGDQVYQLEGGELVHD